MCKAGFAGKESPDCVFPAIVGRPKTHGAVALAVMTAGLRPRRGTPTYCARAADATLAAAAALPRAIKKNRIVIRTNDEEP